MISRQPSDISGYVLAGGESSRMGRSKALLELAGKPLVQHAVLKLRRVCADVAVLGSDPALGVFAPVVRDVHPGCGPMAGMEAALLHARRNWALFLPVDVPFLPTASLDHWVRQALARAEQMGARVLMFIEGDVPQPTLSLVRRDICPFLTSSLERGEYKLFPVLERAARELAVREGHLPGSGMWSLPCEPGSQSMPELQRTGETWWYTTDAQERERAQWFANLNTPEEFAEAVRYEHLLDT